MKVLVTGGAGFIGSHTVDLLIKEGFEVRVLDNFEPQVHINKPDYINPEAEFITGDIINTDAWKKALIGINAVVHLAAMVSVSQSMYQPTRYLNVNTIGTAKMYETIINGKIPIEKIIIASSMSTYGEGAYRCENCGIVHPNLRSRKQLEKKDWEIHCPRCNEYVKPVPTTEDKPQHNLSVYALSKYDQERLALIYGNAHGIATAAMRYFNVYGPRQSLNNPYTGVCAIFSSRIKNNNPPVIYEDGMQTRDFIFVGDIAKANIMALENFDGVDVFNVGTGCSININEVANTLIKLYGSNVHPRTTGEYRAGDVRHAVGDVSKIKKAFGFEAKTTLEEGFKKLVEWGETQQAIDKFDETEKERKMFLRIS